MTKFQALRVRLAESIRVQDQQRQTQALVTDISLQIDLNPTRRGRNLRLLRWLFDDECQETFVSMLGIGSQSLYSKIERGESNLDDRSARKIELALGLAPGWLDRDNSRAILFSNDEFRLVQEAKKSAASAIPALIKTMETLRIGGIA